jgi:ABC-type Fe3+/spermidine/putrescine transport system ATPase subunit
MQAVELNNITHYYDKTKVLEHLNLKILQNKITCLLGSSGSGKTTILRLIAGFEVPAKGEIIINKTVVTKNGKLIVQPSERKIGFVFQDLALWPHFTVYNNLEFVLKATQEQNIEKKVKEMLQFSGLDKYAEKYPHQLSGGQKQLLAISRALMTKPEILLMDEPLANLDVKLKKKILEHIKMLKKNFNLTIVYVTHDHREAFSIADNISIINNGIIEQSGNLEQIKKSNNKYVKYFIEF